MIEKNTVPNGKNRSHLTMSVVEAERDDAHNFCFGDIELKCA